MDQMVLKVFRALQDFKDLQDLRGPSLQSLLVNLVVVQMKVDLTQFPLER